MQVLVIGAGLIGSIYGWALAQGGHEVRHLVRAGRASGLADGLSFDLLDKRPGQPRWFRGDYHLKAVETVSDPESIDLVVFAGHHFALGEVLKDVLPRFGRADVLFLTQNWNGTDEIDAVVPRDRLVFGDAKAGGSWQGDVLVGALQSLDLGAGHPEGRGAAERVARAFSQAGVPCPVHDNMLGYLWTQYAMTAALWPSLVEAGSFEVLLADRKAGLRAMAAMKECLALLELRGLDLKDFPETKFYRTRSRLLLSVALWALQQSFRWSEFMKRTSAHALGDKAEVAAFYTDVLGTARALGHPMPVFLSYRSSIETFTGIPLDSLV